MNMRDGNAADMRRGGRGERLDAIAHGEHHIGFQILIYGGK